MYYVPNPVWVAVPLWVNASAFAGAGDLSGDGNMDMVLRHTDGHWTSGSWGKVCHV